MRYAMHDWNCKVGKMNRTSREAPLSWRASPCISARSSLTLADFHSNIKDDDESDRLTNRRRSWTTRLVREEDAAIIILISVEA